MKAAFQLRLQAALDLDCPKRIARQVQHQIDFGTGGRPVGIGTRAFGRGIGRPCLTNLERKCRFPTYRAPICATAGTSCSLSARSVETRLTIILAIVELSSRFAGLICDFSQGLSRR